MEIALGEYNMTEYSGSKHNQRIIEYFKKSGHSWVKNDETAWCSAFVNWVMAEAGLPKTGKLNARSWLDVGRKVTNPQPGDVVIFWRSSKNSWKGHVGFYVTERNGYIYCLGGNQSNKVNIAGYKKDRLLGYRRLHTNSSAEALDIKSISDDALLREVKRRMN
jgi:uncharacterized protein (TIGR02594 family)